MPITDVEEVTEDLDAVPLLPFAEQGRHRHLEELPEQIEQGRLQGGHGMNHDAQIEGLQPASGGIALGEAAGAPH